MIFLVLRGPHTRIPTRAYTQSTLYTLALSLSRLLSLLSVSHSPTLAPSPVHTQPHTHDNTFRLHYSRHGELAKCLPPPNERATVILTWHILRPGENVAQHKRAVGCSRFSIHKRQNLDLLYDLAGWTWMNRANNPAMTAPVNPHTTSLCLDVYINGEGGAGV